MKTGTLQPAVLWSVLELNFGLIGACIPSLMPLLSVMIGKRKLGTSSTLNEYDKQGSDRANSKKFNRMTDSEEFPLEENAHRLGSDTRLSKSDQNAFDDHVRLVKKQKPGVITVTNQIIQSHEPRDPLSPISDRSLVIPAAWAPHSLPARGHQAGQKVCEGSLNMTTTTLGPEVLRVSAADEQDTVVIVP